eukprot:m.10096 g.10096  ORF g.10096 m.10096 type:complete len:582 (-) comp5526_c0_seq1:2336-4081(-)
MRLGIWFFAVSLVLAGCGSSILAKKPHIVFILLDDLGFDDISIRKPYRASNLIPTPNIAHLRENSTLLTHHYVPAVCSPSRATLLTGRYPIHHGLLDWVKPLSTIGLNAQETTMAQILKKNGYDTHAVGKWHIGAHKWAVTPTFRGFNSFLGFYGGGEDYFTHTQRMAYDMHREAKPECGKGCSQHAFDLAGKYSTTIFTNEAVRRIKEADTTGQNPLFLYLAYQAVHHPLQAPDSYTAKFNDVFKDPNFRIYAGMVACLDDGIGRVMRAIKEAGIWDDTVIIFTSDNGGSVEQEFEDGARNYPLRGGKHSIFEGGVRTSALFKPQKGTVANHLQVYDHLMHSTDWLVTLCDMLSIECKTTFPMDGVSQWPGLSGRSSVPARKHVVIGNTTECEGSSCGFAVSDGRFKYIRGAGGWPSTWSTPCPNYGTSCHFAFDTRFRGTVLAKVPVKSTRSCCEECTKRGRKTCLGYIMDMNNAQCTLLASVTGAERAGADIVSGVLHHHKLPIYGTSAEGHNMLFDLDDDIRERHNIASEHPAHVDRLQKLMDESLKDYHEAKEDPSCTARTTAPRFNGREVVEPFC